MNTEPKSDNTDTDAARLVEARWRELIDTTALARWMDGQGLGAGPIRNPRLLSGGTQNLLLRFERGQRAYVLRRPPRNPRMNGSETMRREARMLAALAGSDVPHPALIAACADEQVLGAGFYLMAPIDGFNATMGLPEPHRSDAAMRARMGLAMIDAIVSLGQLDYAARGVADLGRTENYLARQVGRWRSQLDGYREYPGWPGASGLPGVDAIGHWLDQRIPASFRPGIIHGDFHLANVMFRHDGPELAALVDWELTTIGDPLIDLGWLLATWPDPQRPATIEHHVEPWSGFPDSRALVEHYALRSARNLDAIDWYAVMACYKLALILEGTHARACAGKATRAAGDRLHRHAIALLQRAQSWIERRL